MPPFIGQNLEILIWWFMKRKVKKNDEDQFPENYMLNDEIEIFF